MTTTGPGPEAGDTGSSQRRCVNCGRGLHIPARVPGKRFCSPRCRVADWHRRNDRRNDDQPNQPDQVDRTEEPGTNAVGGPTYGANAVPGAAAPTRDPGSGRCPHCHQPVAVVSVLLTPAAAHVSVPAPPGRQQS